MFTCLVLALIHLIWVTFCIAAPKNESRRVPSELFNSLEELSRLVDIAYCVGTTGVQEPFQCLSHCAEFPDLELITTWNTGILLSDSCGYMAISHTPGMKRIILAFRGTYSITNTIIDLSAYPQAYVPYTGEDPENPSALTQNTKCENCTVHAGFMTSWLNTRETVMPQLSAVRKQYPDYEITLVGHSLGGAVAALAGLEMQVKGWNPSVTTFGEPMVGNQEFVEFIDKHFHMGRYHIPGSDRVKRAFRRVTHVNDPIPLLPLEEWGYAAHAGEIYISKPDLSPGIEDVEICEGDRDSRCIAGAETGALLLDMYRDVNIPLDVFSTRLDPCPSYTGPSGSDPRHQFVLGTQRDRVELGDCASHDATAPLYPLHWDWSLIPARYRLWELFHAHRDYFWRIGLCVPGGDPTG
ncbi:hypothetical protein N7466_000027 [Penicillium verhagenii]|uniref:uncharacterized protein n=1 Tax=Penicillium verhagenii TaxID=1562060 RepID=UPI0025458E76|nr:uncharacterized protein N7466_000027 [Penicillium verhagenii]KAJ5947012.1 hypothetical protein N7466_000027 [Penicillium verhagenii]